MLKIQDMDLKSKIGQLLVVGFEGTEVNDEIIELIKEYKIGNIILFERNCKTPEQIFKLTSDLQKVSIENNGIPLFIAIDQENGMVARIYEGVTHFPGNMAQAATKNEEYSYKIGEYTGIGLKSLGINFNLAPSMDVNSNIDNPVIGVRSFGDNPKEVAKYGVQTILGLQNSGIIATAKHFPGHGDTSVDTHLGLARVEYSRERLNEIELYPFKEAIKAGVKAIMSGHIIFPAYEQEEIPGTLSYNILTELLRNELEFKGLIITDCMEMKAIDNYFGTIRGAKMAIKAGADLICISHTREKQIGALNSILEAVENREIDIEQIEKSVERILKEKESIKTNIKYSESKKNLYNKEHLKLSKEVSEKSIVIYKNENILPINNKKILVISTEVSVLTGAEGLRKIKSFGEIYKEKSKKNSVDYRKISINPIIEEIENIVKLASEYEVVIMCTYNGRNNINQLELVKKIKNKNILLIPMRNPYDYLDLKFVKGCIFPFEYTNNSISSLIEIIEGNIEAMGSNPIKL